MAYSKHKDAPPEQTIKIVQDCFSNVGVNLKHKIYKRMDGIYASIVLDEIGGWGTAGKGTNPEYCLASGYAEAMEHFCNYCAYDTNRLSSEAREYLDFNRYPDEKIISINDLHMLDNTVLEEMTKAYSIEGEECNTDKLIKTWKKFLKTDEISLVPYYSIRKKSEVYLPEAIVGKLCGSTGGGAGNTAEEAIGHGLDEISERYAKYIIYSQKLTPPEITHEYIKKVCPEIFSIISTIEKNKAYKILVMDASLGKNYPVVAVCLINSTTHSYVINFGSHPCFNIALERCLTEMFQFMSLNSETSLKHKVFERWTTYADSVPEVRNWVSLLRDDTGTVPDAFFASTPSWEFVPWGIYEEYTNEFGMKLQINNFLQDGVEDIFIRDFSFLGFPVYRIYIPEYSVSHYTVCDRLLNDYEYGVKLVNSIIEGKVSSISNEENRCLQNVFSHESYIGTWIIRDIKDSYMDLLLSALIKDSSDKEHAIENIKKIDEDFSMAILENENMIKKNYNAIDRNRMISLFYGEFVAEVVTVWNSTEAFVNLCLLLNKYKFIIPKSKNKNTEKLQNVHCQLKRTMLNNTPNQMAIGNYINL